MMVSKFRTRTYYPGEKPCGSDMMPQEITVNGDRLPKKKLFQMMNDAFDGKIRVLQVNWKNKVMWLCSTGWPDGAMWWKTLTNGVTYAQIRGKWVKILGDDGTTFTPKDTLKEVKADMERMPGASCRNTH